MNQPVIEEQIKRGLMVLKKERELLEELKLQKKASLEKWQEQNADLLSKIETTQERLDIVDSELRTQSLLLYEPILMHQHQPVW